MPMAFGFGCSSDFWILNSDPAVCAGISYFYKLLLKWGRTMAISKVLTDVLACPQCKGRVELLPDGSGLLCGACRLKYPIRDEIPIMLIDEAEKVGE
jgi:uncharacterized protein YbaR (Trm112 family)